MSINLLTLFYSLSIGLSVLAVVVKFILWIQLKSTRRIGFISSFKAWFSVHDIHNATSKESKRFRSWNNIINIFLWLGLFFMIVVYVYDTNVEMDTPPQKMPANKKNR